MADGKLIFPVKFDLQSAVREASGDVDRILRRLETQINSKPLKIKIDGGFTNMGVIGGYKDSLEALTKAQQTLAKDGSIEAMRKEMSALILEWDKLSEKERTATDESGKFTGRAGEIVKRFAELTAAANTHARSLNQLMSAADKAATSQEKLARKRAEIKAARNPNMDSLSEVQAALKYFEKYAKSQDQFSRTWEFAIQKVNELKARSQELSDIYKTMTRQNVFNMPEGNLNEVKDKIKALKIQMEQAVPHSEAWNEFSNQLSRLREVEKGMAADQKQAIKTESELRAEREKAALQELANQRKIKAERARNVSDVERERASRQQLIAQKRQELAVLNGEERSLDQVNAKLAIRKRLLESSRQGTSFYDNNWKEVRRLEGKQRDMTSRLPESQRKEQEALNKALIEEAAKRAEIYNKKRRQEAEDLAAQQRKAAEEARIKAESQARAQQENEARKRILNEQRLSYDTLIQKIQMLEAARNKTDIGAARWQRLTNEINKAKESLKVITDEMDKAAKRSERLARLREIMAMSTQSMQGLSARMREYNAQLQKLEYGSQAFDRLSAYIAKLNVEYQKASQYAQDFQNKAFQGLWRSDMEAQVGKLRQLREELALIDRRINGLYQHQNMAGNTTNQSMINQLLDQRMAKEREIANLTKTAEQQQAEREREINKIIESRRAKQKAHSDAVRQTVQARKQERTMLMASEKTVDNITKKLQHWQTKLNSTNLGSAEFTKIAKEVERLTKKLDDYRRKIAEATGQSTSASSTQARNTRKVSEEYSRQLGYIDRLIRRMAVYGSVGMIGNFLTKVREVTAQFELQRVSLGAILQDQNKANQLFSEIKSFALKSPVSILDLTKYTKQLAAYKIGYDELFETTKKLTDVSVGLGVSMDRVVLAYGQVRATGHLRASEIRQFTEMGVPIVEELAAKLSKLNGETVTAAQVMDMVSKRAISFEMVKEVFNDMTSAGGIFYNMQEKQGNTLYGLWAKLGDAASVMYSEIGNTGVINDGMKSLISSMTWLMKNWRGVIGEIAVAAAGFGAYKLAQTLVTKNTVLAAKAADAQTRALIRLRAANTKHNATQILSAQYAIKAAAANQKAALSTNLWTAAKHRLVGAVNTLKSALVGSWLTLAITGIFAIGTAFAAAYEKATRLNRELAKIKEETTVLQSQSVRNFEYLASAAVSAADGSKQQKDALDELERTYKDMVPAEALKIENLRKMKGNYDELTQAVREYIAAEQEQKAINTVNETEGAVQTDMQKRLREKMIDKDLGFLALSEAGVTRFFAAFQKTSQDASKTIKEQFMEAFKEAGLKGAEQIWNEVKNVKQSFFTWGASRFGDEDEFLRAHAAIGELSRSYREQEERIKGVREGYRQATADLGEYTEAMEDYDKWVEESSSSGETFLQNQQNVNMQIRGMASWIRDAMKNVGLTWKSEWANIVTSIDPNDLNKTTTLNIKAILAAVDLDKYPELHRYIQQYQKLYDGLIPPDPTVQQIRAKLLAISQSMGVSMDIMRRFLWDGSASVDEHLKYLNDQIEQYEAKLKKMQTAFANSGIFGTIASFFLKGKIEETTKIIEALKEQAEFVKTYTVNNDKGGGRKSDTKLQELQEINQTLEKINKEYDDLSKKEGKSMALEDIRKQFKGTLDYTNKLGRKFGLRFDYPTEFRSLQQYRDEILKVMKSLKNLKGGEKAVLEFQTMIGKADSDELQKQIEEQLKYLREKIFRTKVAKEFYDKILEQTGDIDLATRITYTIYPETGRDLYTDIQDEIRRIFKTGDGQKDLTLGWRLDSAFDNTNERINYRELDKIYAEYQNDIIEKNRDTARRIIAEGQKTAAANIATWEKELAKAESYERKRTGIINRETQRRAEIIKSNLPQDEKDRLVEASRSKQSTDLADLNIKEFRESEDYVRVFENLDAVSTATLRRMRTTLREMIDDAKEASPGLVKQLTLAFENVDAQISGRGFGNDMVQSVKDYMRSIKDMKLAKQEHAAAKAEYKAQEPQLDAGIDAAKAEETAAQQALNALLADELATETQIVEAKLRLNMASSNVAKAEGKKADAVKKAKNAEEKVTDEQDKQKKATAKFFKDMEAAAAAADQLAGILGDVKDTLGIAEDSAAGMVFDAAIQGLQEFSKIMNIIIGLQVLYNIVTSANPWIAIAAAVLAVTSALAGFISARKVKKANQEIERQQELLDQLEYSYSRLEKAADRLFGADWLANQNRQLQTLEAEALAKEKQAEAERSKGKKEDKKKTKQYLEEARDIRDQIADMEGSISEKMFGSDLASAARDFAQAWLDAYKEFGNTADAMSEKFHEMIENMIVESLLAKVMERALEPAFKMIDGMSGSDFYNESFWERLTQTAEQGARDADHGASVVMDWVEKMGIDMRDIGGEFSGIAKNIAGATSEEINSAAAIGNTLLYYASPIPRIDENVARIAAIMESGGAPVITGSSYIPSDYTALLTTANEHLSSLPRMEQHLAEIHTLLNRVIVPGGGRFGVNTFVKG